MGSSEKRSLRMLAALFLVGAGLVVGSLIAEVGLRLAGYEGDYERRLFVFTGDYPLLRKESWVLGVDWNQPEGLRIRQDFVAYHKPAGERRLLFLGDSGTYGWGVPRFLNFPALTAKRFGPETRVINAGVYGFNTCDTVQLYREHLHRIRADVVVLGLFMANDINTNLLCSERLVRYPGWIVSLRNHAYESSALFHFMYLNALRVNNRLRLLTPSMGDADPPYFSRLHLLEPTGLHMLNYRQGELAGYLRPPGPLTEHAFDLLGSLLQKLRDETNRDGARLIVLLIPAPPAIYGRYLAPAQPNVIAELTELGISIPVGELDLKQPTRRVLGICERLEVLCIDPTRDLRAAALTGTQVLRPADDHPSVDGHRILAESLWEHRSALVD